MVFVMVEKVVCVDVFESEVVDLKVRNVDVDECIE